MSEVIVAGRRAAGAEKSHLDDRRSMLTCADTGCSASEVRLFGEIRSGDGPSGASGLPEARAGRLAEARAGRLAEARAVGA
jgi:hypothetical protein